MPSKLSRRFSYRKNTNILTNNRAKKKLSKKRLSKKKIHWMMNGGLSGITYFQLGEEEYNMSCYNSNFVEKQGNNFDLAAVYYEIAFKLGHMPACAKLAWLTLFGKPFIKSDYSKCFNMIHDKDHPDCQAILSLCYLHGFGCKKNEQLSFSLVNKSVKLNSKYGFYTIGEIYYYGLPEICEQSYIKAFENYKISAENGVEIAQRKLADLYNLGLGIKPDTTLAIKWYKLAGYQCDIESCFKLIYENKEDKTFDIEKWYYIALYHIEYENSEKIVNYIQYLENSLHKSSLEIYNKLVFLGQFSEALKYGILNIQTNLELKYNVLWSILTSSKNMSIDKSYIYEQLKDDRSPDALGILSYYYYMNKDYNKTFSLSKQSSDFGNKYGQFTLSILYLNNLGGVSYDDNKYYTLNYLSAEQGLIDAKINLGICYKSGKGVLQNFIEAIKIFKSVSLYETKSVLYQLADMIENGKGVIANKIDAIRWYRRFELQMPLIKKSDIIIQNIINTESLFSFSEKDIDNILISLRNISRLNSSLSDDINILISRHSDMNFKFGFIETGFIKWMNIHDHQNYYIGECNEYKPHGIGKFKYSNSDTYTGNFIYGEPNGIGNMQYANGSQYIGEFKNYEKHGLGIFFNKDYIYQGQWLNNKQHGIGIYTNDKDSLIIKSKGKWIEGFKYGPFIYEIYNKATSKIDKYVFYENKDTQIDNINSYLPAQFRIENPYSVIKNNYITIMIYLHGSEIVNSNCIMRSDGNHIRIISPVSCGSVNIVNKIFVKNVFNRLFNICNLDFNKNSSSYQKMKKFIDITNMDLNGIVYNLIENTTTLRKPLIDHEYSFDLDDIKNAIYLVDTNYLSAITNQEMIDIFRQSYTNIFNVDQINRFDILPNIKRLLNIVDNENFMRSTLINKLLELGYQTINIIDLTCRNINEQQIQENLTIDKPYYCDYTVANPIVDDSVMSNPFQ